MPDRPQNRTSTLISEEAADWLSYLKQANLGADERQRYVRWLKQSPAHIAEMLRLASLDGVLRETDLEGIPGQSAADRESTNVVDGAFRQVEPDDSPSESAERPVRPSRFRRAASLSVLTLALLLGTVAKYAWFDKIIETEAGEWRHFTLADGSIARVGPRSRLRVDFDEDQRDVYLSRGEAVFQVAKDQSRPFLVHAEWTLVRAVGTEFGVAHHNDRVVVTVAEGEVAVSQGRRAIGRSYEPDNSRDQHEPAVNDAGNDVPVVPQKNSKKNPAKNQSVAVSAGEQVSVTREMPMTVQHVDPLRELAWARGKLIFDSDTTLAQAIEQFNRRNRMQIEIEDSTLAHSLVCCIFSADDPESFALSVATKPNVSLVRESGGRLRLVVADARASAALQ
jgi:transmembrane sensor